MFSIAYDGTNKIKLTKNPGINRIEFSKGFKYFITRKLFTYGSWRLNSRINQDSDDTFPMSFNITTQWSMAKNTNFGVDYSFGPYDIKDDDTKFDKRMDKIELKLDKLNDTLLKRESKDE